MIQLKRTYFENIANCLEYKFPQTANDFRNHIDSILQSLEQLPKLERELRLTETEHKRVLNEKFQVIDENYKLKQETQKLKQGVKDFIKELKTNGLNDECLNGEVIHRLQQLLQDETKL